MSWSLRKRFFAISSAVTLSALIAAGILLVLLFERDITARVDTEIHNHFAQLVGALEVEQDGAISKPAPMADPRFRQPGSGVYWQVETRDEPLLRSRSLWDMALKTPGFEGQAIEQPKSFPGPFGEPVLVHARLVTLDNDPAQRQLRVLVGVDQTEVRAPVLRFAVLLGISLLVLAAAMLAVSAIQLKVVMEPLTRLRQSIRDVREGRASRVTDDFPVEIAPVSAKLNALLQHQEQLIERARSRAGNFAHGLKTPLTIIDVLVSDLRNDGLKKIADDVGEQTVAIRKLVDRELARSQLVAGHGQPVLDARSVIDEIINTMKHLPRGRELQFLNEVPADQVIRIDRDDFIELLGNILDNARKWTRSLVVVRLEKTESGCTLSVSDDGPGVDEEYTTAILLRGQRLDEKTQGSGIGLAIVNDIAVAYGFDVAFLRAPIGGLEVRITFPN